MNNRAALYLRSSKDRRDVSIQDQRRELQELASSRGLMIQAEFVDVVESGKDEDRPGFQSLLQAIRDPNRGWTKLLLKDTSRLARRRVISVIFEEQECLRHGVEVIYANIPDGDAITTMLLKSLLQAMDEWHSLTSRQKGLAGMAENVRQGYRGAGPAPFGYRLKRIDIGLVREGEAITKSVLEADEHAASVKHYLTARARRIPRTAAANQAGLKKPTTSLVAIEWNALTYAGCTTLHVFNERINGGGFKGGRKRRPRSQWMIQPNTHEALISREEAEVILIQLETSVVGKAVSEAKAGNSPYLLTGMLYSTTGMPWEGNEGKYYRVSRPGNKKRCYVPCEALNVALVNQMVKDMQSIEFAAAVADSVRGEAPDVNAPISKVQAELATVVGHIAKAQTFMLQAEEPGVWARKLDALERDRQRLSADLASLKEEAQLSSALVNLTPQTVLTILEEQADRIVDTPRERLKGLLQGMIDRIDLDPDTLACSVRYRVAAETNRVSMVLPRGFEPRFKP